MTPSGLGEMMAGGRPPIGKSSMGAIASLPMLLSFNGFVLENTVEKWDRNKTIVLGPHVHLVNEETIAFWQVRQP